MSRKRNIESGNYKILGKPVGNFSLDRSSSFLVCSDSFWHNGIHLENVTESLNTVYEGKIVACRYSPYYKTRDFNLDSFCPYDADLSPGNFAVHNYFEEIDGKYQLKEEYKPENEPNKRLAQKIKHFLGFGYSNSFILIEHNAEKSVLLKNNTREKIKYQFYTVYNHLRPLNYCTNKEKAELFFYTVELKFNNIFPYSYVKGYATLENLQLHPNNFIQIPSETKLYEKNDYFQYTLNGETKYAFVEGNLFRSLSSHYETKRPAKDDNEKANDIYLKKGQFSTHTDMLFVYDSASKANRCVIGILTKNDTIGIAYSDLTAHLEAKDFTAGLKISDPNGYIFFDEETWKKIEKWLRHCKIWGSPDDSPDNIPQISYNLKSGILYKRHARDKGKYSYLWEKFARRVIPKFESHFVSATRLLSDTPFESETIEIPCELKITPIACTSKIIKRVSYTLGGKTTSCFIKSESCRELSEPETKRKLRPYEPLDNRDASHFLPRTASDVRDDILVYDTSDIKKRAVKAIVPKSTSFKIKGNEIASLIEDKKYDQGIFAEYDTGIEKGSGYIYLPWGYDLPNADDKVESNLKKIGEEITKATEILKDWFECLNQKEQISFAEFSVSLKKNPKIKDDGSVYERDENDDFIHLPKGTVVGYGGTPLELENEKKTECFPTSIHFETFCFDTGFMKFNKNRVDYISDFKIKRETAVYKQNPVTETVIKPLPVLQFSHKLKKSLLERLLFKPSFIHSPELTDEALEMLYFKKTGNEVCLIDSESFVELEIAGRLNTFAENEYVYQTEISGERNRKLKYYYEPVQNKERFYISKKTFENKLQAFEVEKNTTYYLLEGDKKLLQSEIFEKPAHLVWRAPPETVSGGTYKNAHTEITDKTNEKWALGIEENSSSKIWINKNDIDDKIGTEKPVEEINYEKWDDFFEEIKVSDFGKYRCTDEKKFLSALGLENEENSGLKYFLNQNKEVVSSLYFKRNSEWKEDEGFVREHTSRRLVNEQYLKQMHTDYSFWNSKTLPVSAFYFHPVKFLSLLDKNLPMAEFNPYEGKKYEQIYNYDQNMKPADEEKKYYIFEKTGEKKPYNSYYVKSTPGIVAEYSWGVKIKGNKVPYYAGITGFFNAQYLSEHPSYKEYWHEGVDFRGPAGTTIYSLIYGKVIRCGERPKDNNGQIQGFILLQSLSDENLYYLALHVDKDSLLVKNGQTLTPEMPIGHTMLLKSSKGKDISHLHVSVIRLPKGTIPENDINGAIAKSGNTFPTWGNYDTPNQKIWKNMINPFDYEDSNTWQGRYL